MVEEAQETERKKYVPCDQKAFLYIMQQEPYDQMQSAHSSSGYEITNRLTEETVSILFAISSVI